MSPNILKCHILQWSIHLWPILLWPICLCHNRVCIILICKEVKGTITIHLDIIVVNSNLIYCLVNKCVLYWNVFTYGTKNIFRWDKMRDMTWCKLYTHLSWSWCMKKPNSGNSGVRNIVHSASPRCTIFRTPLLPSLGFFIHHSQERCVYTKTSFSIFQSSNV